MYYTQHQGIRRTVVSRNHIVPSEYIQTANIGENRVSNKFFVPPETIPICKKIKKICGSRHFTAMASISTFTPIGRAAT